MATRHKASARSFRLPSTLQSPMSRLEPLKVKQSLLDAACRMALGGETRATTRQIAERAEEESGIVITAWQAGVALSEFGLTTRTSHGKIRLVLEYESLKPLHDSVTQEIEALAPRVETAVAGLDEAISRTLELGDKLRQAQELKRREGLLRNELRKYQDVARVVAQLERQVADGKQQAKIATQLQGEIKGLEKTTKTLPGLQRRREKLQERADEVKATEHSLASQERELERREESLKAKGLLLAKRAMALDLADLEEAIESSRRELDDVASQLGEKQSLLDRVLGRKSTGGTG